MFGSFDKKKRKFGLNIYNLIMFGSFEKKKLALNAYNPIMQNKENLSQTADSI